MVEYTIDDIRGPTVAREMAQLKSFVLEKFNGAIADAEAAAAQAATDAANAVLSSIDSRVGALEGDMTTAQADIVTNANAILALDGAAVKLAGTQTITGAKTFSVSPTVPAPTNATDAATKKYVDDADTLKLSITDVNTYAVGLTGNQNVAGIKTLTSTMIRKTGIAPTPTGYTETNGVSFSKSDDSVFAQINAAGNATANFIIMKANSRVNTAHYSKLYLRVNDSGKCDLVMESSTSQGYEQHTIYSFGV